ncbi:hypothetical protein ACFVYD_36225 [Streptomyces sp. NPDC058301]|uniref:hypothetical protein n=1 Tax=Streptomyces sp. NPDC058301 TaxID=3346436 RepID=UPI0036E8C611
MTRTVLSPARLAAGWLKAGQDAGRRRAMADIRMSTEVRTLLGPDGVARASAVTLANGRCLACEKKLDPAEPANVVVRVGGPVAHVRYAHQHCAESAVVELPAQRPRPAVPDEVPGVAMQMTAALVAHGSSILPVLVAELLAPVYVRDRAGSELTDLLTSHLLQRGFHLVGRLRQAPGHVAHWQAAITPVHGPDGEMRCSWRSWSRTGPSSTPAPSSRPHSGPAPPSSSAGASCTSGKSASPTSPPTTSKAKPAPCAQPPQLAALRRRPHPPLGQRQQVMRRALTGHRG